MRDALEAGGDHDSGSEPSVGASAPAPITPRERLDSMDLIRGVAIFGILVVNMAFFAMPFAHAIYPAAYDAWPAADRWSHLIVKVLFEYKFISTFSVLFGAGLIMQWLRASSRGASFAPLHYRRMALLALFGLMHGFLLWYGDILFIYACVGSVFFLFRTLKPRTMFVIAAALLAISMVFTTGFTALNVLTESAKREAREAASMTDDGATAEIIEEGSSAGADAASGADAADAADVPRGFDAMMKAQFDFFNDSWVRGEELAYRDGPWADAMLFRGVSFAFALLFTVFGFGWHILAMFLIGGALMKLDFFSSSQGAMQKRAAMIGLILGGVLEIAYGALMSITPGVIDWPDIAAAPLQALGAPLLCLGYVGALAWVAGSGAGRVLLAPLRAVGRMALSAYLLTTVIVTFLMYHWGLGWFGSVGRFDQLMIAVVVYAGLVVFCTAWMACFRYGPFERLWRAVTYARATV